MELTLVLTRNCNLGCSYCYAGEKVNDRMSDDLARQALGWAVAQQQPGGTLQVGYFGGEPLLAWDQIQRLHPYARQLAEWQGITVTGTITTNATLLNEARMLWCQDQDIVIGVSIDGDQTAHDTLRPTRGGQSSYAQVLRGLKVALEHQPLTETITVVDPRTVERLAASVDVLFDHGVRVLSLSLNYAADWDLGSLETLRQQLELVGDRYAANFRAGYDCYIAGIDTKVIGHLKGGLKQCDRCSAGIGELALAPSGTWYPCERMVGNDGAEERCWALGNAHERPDGAPDPERVRWWTGRHRQIDPMCAQCPLQSRCVNTCACSNIWDSGDPGLPGESLCASEQIWAAVADRVAAELIAESNQTFIAKHYRSVRPSAVMN